MMFRQWFVLCLGDEDADGLLRKYELATRRAFYTLNDAKRYASTIARGRKPFVVETIQEEDGHAVRRP